MSRGASFCIRAKAPTISSMTKYILSKQTINKIMSEPFMYIFFEKGKISYAFFGT